LHPTATLFPYTTLFRSEADRSDSYGSNQRIQEKIGTYWFLGYALSFRHSDGCHADNFLSYSKLVAYICHSVHILVCVRCFLCDKDRKSTRLNSSHVSIS